MDTINFIVHCFTTITLTHPRLQLPADLAEGHVLFHAVHPVLELDPGHIHVRNHRANVTDDGGEDEDAGQKVRDHKQVLGIVLGRGRLSDGGQRQRGPVEAVDVLPGQRRVARTIEVVHPVVAAEAERVADGKVQARVPVDQHEDGEHHLADAERVRVSGGRLRPVEPLQEPGQPQQPIDAHDNGTGDAGIARAGRPPHVRNVGGNHGEQVEAPSLGREVVLAEFGSVSH